MNVFIVSKVDKVLMFDVDTFKKRGEIPIKLLKADTREPNEVIGMAVSQCENYLAIISGKNLIRNAQSQNQLFIYKKTHKKDSRWEQTDWVLLKE